MNSGELDCKKDNTSLYVLTKIGLCFIATYNHCIHRTNPEYHNRY
jgi:hypothetical protein